MKKLSLAIVLLTLSASAFGQFHSGLNPIFRPEHPRAQDLLAIAEPLPPLFRMHLAAVEASTPSGHATALGWTWSQGTGDPATSFPILRSATAGGPYTQICGGTGQPICPPVTQFAYVDLTVNGGDTWFYVVEASGPGGVSQPSNEVKVLTPFLPPNAPSGLSAVPK